MPRHRAVLPIFRLVLALGLLLSAPASATSTRILSLGGDGEYLEDEHNVLFWPGSLPDYPNVGILELGDVLAEGDDWSSPVRQGGGVHFRLARSDRWGTGALYLSEAREGEQLPGTWTALWACTCEGLQLGLLGSWSRFAETVGGQDAWQEDTAVGLGLRADLGGRLYGDLAGVWYGTDRDYGGGAVEEGRWGSYAWRLRLFIGLRDNVAAVPFFENAGRDHLAWREDLGDPPVTDLDARLTRAGLGLNVLPDADNLLVASYEYRWGKEDYSRLPWYGLSLEENRLARHVLRLGAESRQLAWLTLRGAVRQEIRDDERATHFGGGFEYRQDFRDPTLELSVGIGLHLGAFDLDLLVNDKAPFSLGFFLTGAGQEEDVNFTSATLSYTF
jgi:hypothetical protein